MASHSQYGPMRLTARTRRQEAMALRIEGYTFEQIAQQLGYSGRGTAHNAVSQELAVVRKANAELAADVLALELERLDHMQAGLSARVRAGEDAAVRSALAIMDRRAKYLGLWLEDQAADRAAGALETMAGAQVAQTAWLWTAMTAILDRLPLTDEQRAQAPSIIAGYLEESAPAVDE